MFLWHGRIFIYHSLHGWIYTMQSLLYKPGHVISNSYGFCTVLFYYFPSSLCVPWYCVIISFPSETMLITLYNSTYPGQHNLHFRVIWLPCMYFKAVVTIPFVCAEKFCWHYSISQEICTRFLFAVLCCGYTLTDFPISIRLTSLALWQSNDCPSASKATLMNMDKYFMWIHYERFHNHNKAKHNKTVCIFLGVYCTCDDWSLSHLLNFSQPCTQLTLCFVYSKLDISRFFPFISRTFYFPDKPTKQR